MPDITITATDGGSFSAYLAKPAGAGPFPGLVLIQEIFGVNQVMRDLADAYADQGYLVACPDIFWRQEPGVQITDKSEAEWQKAFALMSGFNETKGIEDLIATLDHLRALPDCTGKVGTVGYCLGGKLAFLMATRSSANCNVSYYGVSLQDYLAEVSAITKPLLLHIAAEDKFVPKEAQEKVRERLSTVPLAQVHTYAGVNHAFARQGGEHWDATAAATANGRTAEFLSANLK